MNTFIKILLPVFIYQITEAKEVVVAVIDTGAEITHPLIRDSLWTNPGESGLDSNKKDRATNGIDDDANGYVDDVHGWNFARNSNEVKDYNGHGTHISGIIAHTSSAKLMELGYVSSPYEITDTVVNTVAAIHYAIKMKVDIINYSGGGDQPDSQERRALEEAGRAGIIIFAAAGNNSRDSDIQHYYPADYGLDNIISIGAIESSGNFARYSNFGFKTVDIVAIGSDVKSSLPGGKIGEMSGTSQATAVASAVAANILSESEKHLSTAELKEKLIESGVHDQKLIDKTRFATKIGEKLSRKLASELESTQ